MAVCSALLNKEYVHPVGVDWGTTHTVITYYKEGSSVPEILKARTGEDLHPSAIYFNQDPKKDNLYAKAAIGMIPNENVVTCVKRAVGVSSGKIIQNNQTDSFNASMSTTGRALPKFRISRIDNKEEFISAEKIVTEQLTYFRKLIENEVGPEVAFVVTMPENWGDPPTNMMKRCLEKANFKPLMDTITEPAGAQFAYRAADEASQDDQFLVIDIGDGTTDISLLQQVSSGEYRTISLGGSEFLGSRDIDLLLLEALEAEAKKEANFKPEIFQHQKRMLLSKMKELKHKLSELEEATETVYGITGDSPFVFKVNREKKMNIVAPFYENLRKVIHSVFIEKASACQTFTVKDLMASVNVVYLAGGGSKDPVVADVIVPEILPNTKIMGKYGQPGTINPDVVVSRGAALWCASQMKIPVRLGLPMEAVHWRVLPKNLGVEVTSKTGPQNGEDFGWFRILIPKQSVIPTSVSEDIFTTTVKDQPNFQVRVYQGEGRFTNEEGVSKIGVYDVPLKVPNFFPKITVEFEVDEKGLLTVNAGEEGEDLRKMEFQLNV